MCVPGEGEGDHGGLSEHAADPKKSSLTLRGQLLPPPQAQIPYPPTLLPKAPRGVWEMPVPVPPSVPSPFLALFSGTHTVPATESCQATPGRMGPLPGTHQDQGLPPARTAPSTPGRAKGQLVPPVSSHQYLQKQWP